ncbi:MAG TPA: hypothetical protein VGX25_25215 [Actinophytocola sp.]|uniref:hypothetical protein n=1 Tax=Actinophytocola sp. TaxID=1872138 RepID=UPI002DDD351A|nr:hypothetical protein [Actinophytocola sp.]HEV2782705.1 hypothetical protein [Actinophytocola sp.]
MPPRPRRPGGGDGGDTTTGRPGGGDSTSGRPSQQHGSIDAGNGITSAQTGTQTLFEQARPGSAGAGQPTAPSTAELRQDLDPTPRPGETPEQAAARVEAAEAELAVREAIDTYNGLGEEPPRLNIGQNDAAHAGDGAHTVERHGPDVPLNRGDAPPGDRTIEGRIYGDPPWNRPENWSYRWTDESTMNRTVNDYVRANWDDIRSELALNGQFEGTFDAGHRVGEGFYNDGMHGSGPRNAHYAQTSYVTVRLRLVPGDPPGVMVVTAYPSGLP